MPEYNIWRGIKKRCHNQTDKAWKWYGAKGVRVCQEWRDSFACFLAAVGRRPSADYSLDRWPDPKGNYEPGNVRWATDTQQNRNRGDFNAVIEWRGEKRTISEWAVVTSIPADRLYWRLQRMKWPPDKAFTCPDARLMRPSRLPMSAEARANMSRGQISRREREKSNGKTT